MEFVELRDGKCLPTYSFSLMDGLVVVVFTCPLPRDGGMGKTMEPQKPGNFPGFGTEIV